MNSLMNKSGQFDGPLEGPGSDPRNCHVSEMANDLGGTRIDPPLKKPGKLANSIFFRTQVLMETSVRAQNEFANRGKLIGKLAKSFWQFLLSHNRYEIAEGTQ